MGDYSGYGKNTYTMQTSIISRTLDVQVQVTSPITNSSGASEVVVAPIDPEVVLYEKHPLYGIQFQRTLSNLFTLNNSKEIEVVSEPYFFGTEDMHDTKLSYKWNINNSEFDGDTTRVSRVFRQAEGTSGTSFISVAVENAEQILQSARGEFSLVFKKSQSTKSTF